ncbi:PLP-dependent transferase [Exidia glandulosa HHB12029]|uniref:PLP-dependent transferase n=1 Tax=Exidia glandulosa HHB12029 TaxID=1314781 RepID=A0A165BDW6_EXIGL|nr:PLP-dependent transferase [Exidia glandulosa HHB12029]
MNFPIASTILDTLSPPHVAHIISPYPYTYATMGLPRIPAAYAWAREFTGRPLLDMAQGTPGAPPPGELLEAMARAASDPAYAFRYGDNGGERVLRGALAREMQRIYGTGDVKEEDVAITAGCNMAFFASVVCLAQRGEEVIIPVPWYFNHHMTLTMLGITPIALAALPEDGFVPSVEAAERLITDKTRAIVLVTPNNPTGAIYPPATLKAFFELAQRRNIALILDETYRDFIDSPPHALFSDMDWRSTLIHLFSFSKSYALPGTRLGAVVASPSFLSHLNKALDTIQICPPRSVQIALASLISSSPSVLHTFIASTSSSLKLRHASFREVMQRRGWTLGAGGDGGYFAFVRHPFARGVTGVEVCEWLARTKGVVMLPATFFGFGAELDGERWIRASVAGVPDERIEELDSALRDAEQHFAGQDRSRVGVHSNWE